MVKCPYCQQESISSWRVNFSNPGKEVLCPSCQKVSIVPYWPKTIALALIGLSFLGTLFVEDTGVLVLLLMAAPLYILYTHFDITLLTIEEPIDRQ